MENICAVIPAYNEEKTIGSLVRGLHTKIKTVIVIDDGSTDNTSQAAGRAGAIVLRHDFCRGKGAALTSGYDYSLDKNFDAVLNLDADGQHNWQEADKFLDAGQKENAGIIIGSRMAQVKNMPWLRLFTNRLTSTIISTLIKQKIEDTQCGYRLIKKEVIEKIKFSTSHFDTETELLIKAARSGYKIISVPIQTIYRQEKSKINRILDTVRFIRLIWRCLWRA